MTVGEHAESLNSIRQLLAMHTSLVEEDWIVIEETRLGKDMAAVEKDVVALEIAQQSTGCEKPLGERLEGLMCDQDPKDPEFRMHRTGGGGAQFSLRIQDRWMNASVSRRRK